MYVLKQLKKDMEFNRELSNFIEVLKNVASSEFRRLQGKRERSAEFFESLEGFFQSVDWQLCRHLPLLRQQPSFSSAIVVITSDEGFSGGLNAMLITTAAQHRKRKDDEFIVLGEKGARFLEEMGETFYYLEGIGPEVEYGRARRVSDFLLDQYLRRRWGSVLIVYPRFVSISLQQVEVFEFLPFKPKPQYSQPDVDLLGQELIVEPLWERVVNYLVRKWAASMVYEIFWESKLSEWAARIIHLEGSHQNLSQWYKELRFRYFRSLHELRDKNIREIFASRLEE